MQGMKIMKFLRQWAVLVQRNLRLIANDKLVLASLILQSPLMVVVILMVGDPTCFTANLVDVGSRTILFVLSAICAFMGTLNAYREICKEREIIFREASVGVSLLATVLAKAVVLLAVEIAQAAVLTLGFVRIIKVPQNHLLMDTNLEIFVTVLLMLFTSSAIGLLVSASLKSSESAVLLVLVLMIGQVVFSGVMFPLEGGMSALSALIVCRWGMGALGASTDLNSRLAWLQAGFDGPMYDATIPNLLHCWQMMVLISAVCILAAWLVLALAFRCRKA